MADRVAGYMTAYTLYSSVRPFGCSVLLSVYEEDGCSLWSVDPSGEVTGLMASALGKGKQVGKTHLEKLNFGELSAEQGVKEAARMYFYF